MNTREQMMHLWRKDWHRTQWMFLLLSATVVAAIVFSRPEARIDVCQNLQMQTSYVSSASGVSCDHNLLGLIQTLALLVLMIFVASVIQDDSPTDTQSFWTTQPISANVMLGEKLIFLLTSVLMLTTFAQIASLMLNGLLVLPSLPSIGFTLYGVVSFVLICILVSAVGRGTQAFILMAVGFALLRLIRFLPMQYIAPQLFTVERATSGFRADVWIAAAVGAIGWIYLAQTVRPKTRVRVAWGMLIVLVLAWDSGAKRGIRFFTIAAERPDPTLPEVRYSVSATELYVIVRLEMDAPKPGHRYVIACTNWTLQSPTFRTSLPGEYSYCGAGSPGMVQPLERDSSNIAVVSATFPLSRERLALPQRYQGAKLVFDGFIEEQTSAPLGEIPAERGAWLTAGSRRISREYQQIEFDHRKIEQLQIDVQNATQHVTYVPVDIADFRVTDGMPSNYFAPVQLDENSYKFVSFNSAGTDSMELVIDPRKEVLGRPDFPRWNSYSLALPGPGVLQLRAHVTAKCSPQCEAEPWFKGKIKAFTWKHLAYKPIHQEFQIPNR